MMPPAPPTRSSGVAGCFGIIGVVAAVGMVGILIIAMLGFIGDDEPVPPAPTTPGPRPTTTAPRPTSPAPQPTTVKPKPTSAKPKPTEPARRKKLPDTISAAQLPPWNPTDAPIRRSKTRITSDRTLTHNPVYDLRPPVTECTEWPKNASEKEYQAASRSLIDCLSRSWRARTGYSGIGSSVEFFGDSVQTPCGTVTWFAVYCSGNKRIYIGAEMYDRVYDRYEDWAFPYWTLFHEFAHHIQDLTGILSHAYTLNETRNSISRRVELQAVCWEMQTWPRSNGFPMTTDLMWWWYKDHEGDELHGTLEHIRQWAVQGYRHDKLGACWTFQVDQEAVR